MADRFRDEDLKKAILAKLWRKGKFGHSYLPKKKALSKIPPKFRGRAEDQIVEMWKDKLINFEKKKKCISIRVDAKGEVKEMVKGEIPSYYLEGY